MVRTGRQSLNAEEDEYEHSNVLMIRRVLWMAVPSYATRRVFSSPPIAYSIHIPLVPRRFLVPAERTLKPGASLRPAYDEYLLGSRPEDQRLRATGRAEGDDTKRPSGIMENGEDQFVTTRKPRITKADRQRMEQEKR
jgi:hypothetical protein